MQDAITIHDKTFKPYLSAQAIAERVALLGQQIARDYAGRRPLFIVVLNGAYVFAADLLRAYGNGEAELTFIRLSSYAGTASSGTVKSIVGLSEDIAGREVIVVEDIVDTGQTMTGLLAQLGEQQPKSIQIATLLDKPAARTHPVSATYVGFEIPNKFVVGYGLDYDELGRNLSDIYQITAT